VFPLHALTSARRFIVVHPCSIACESPSFLTIPLQNWHALFHAWPFVLICKLFWQLPYTNFVIARSSWMVEYAYPQRLSNLSTISVTVVRLTSWTGSLTLSTLSTVREVVGLREWSSSVTVYHFGTFLHIDALSFLGVIQFSPYFANLLLRMSEVFTSSDLKYRMASALLNNGVIRKPSRHVHTMIARALLNVMAAL